MFFFPFSNFAICFEIVLTFFHSCTVIEFFERREAELGNLSFPFFPFSMNPSFHLADVESFLPFHLVFNVVNGFPFFVFWVFRRLLRRIRIIKVPFGEIVFWLLTASSFPICRYANRVFHWMFSSYKQVFYIFRYLKYSITRAFLCLRIIF